MHYSVYTHILPLIVSLSIIYTYSYGYTPLGFDYRFTQTLANGRVEWGSLKQSILRLYIRDDESKSPFRHVKRNCHIMIR